MHMKNILITGGAGYIGSHIIELLIKNNFNAFIIDNLSTGYKKLINLIGIESPGLTSSLAIAEYVKDIID